MTVVVNKSAVRLRFWIRKQGGSWKDNLTEMNRLLPCRSRLEEVISPYTLIWDEPREDKISAYIDFVVPGGYSNPEANWTKIHQAVADAVIPFEKCLKECMGDAG